MADNLQVNAGSGPAVAADELTDATLGGIPIKVQFVKIMDGTLDGTTKVAASASGIRVDPRSAVDLGPGTGGGATQRMVIDNSQLSPLLTGPSPISRTSGYQLIDLPSERSATSGGLATSLQGATAGGLSRTRTLVLNNTNAIVIKAAPGQVYKIRATNNSATIAYIKLYDAISATVGVGTPVDTIMIPASTSGAGIMDTTDVGTIHTTGITFIVTTGIADTDIAAPAAGTYIVTIYYK